MSGRYPFVMDAAETFALESVEFLDLRTIPLYALRPARPADGHVRLLLAVDLVLLPRRRRPAFGSEAGLFPDDARYWKGRAAMAGWLLPALGYVVLVGVAGITTKVALRTIDLAAGRLLGAGRLHRALGPASWLVYQKPMVLGSGGGWAIVTAFAAAGGPDLLLLRALEGRRLRGRAWRRPPTP